MNLARPQNAFQAGVLLGDSAISRSILDSWRLDRAARFKIYFDAYRFRLAEFLSNGYPVLRSFLGDKLFGLLSFGLLSLCRGNAIALSKRPGLWEALAKLHAPDSALERGMRCQ